MTGSRCTRTWCITRSWTCLAVMDEWRERCCPRPGEGSGREVGRSTASFPTWTSAGSGSKATGVSRYSRSTKSRPAVPVWPRRSSFGRRVSASGAEPTLAVRMQEHGSGDPCRVAVPWVVRVRYPAGQPSSFRRMLAGCACQPLGSFGRLGESAGDILPGRSAGWAHPCPKISTFRMRTVFHYPSAPLPYLKDPQASCRKYEQFEISSPGLLGSFRTLFSGRTVKRFGISTIVGYDRHSAGQLRRPCPLADLSQSRSRTPRRRTRREGARLDRGRPGEQRLRCPRPPPNPAGHRQGRPRP